MEKRWVQETGKDGGQSLMLAKELNIDLSLASILVQRGVRTFDEARHFFRPELAQLHDPLLMKGMEAALLRIENALKLRERILIYGDYDVDGTTAVSLVYSFFKQFTDYIDYYIPDRHSEGYGISFRGIDYAREHGFSLIIALDCGIRSNDKVDYAREAGIDFIICDHHLPGDEIPDAVAVLDPKQADCLYPFKELCGCGIGFKLVQAYCSRHNIPAQAWEQYLDLVMVSIAADIVPIVDENRVLAFHGLHRLNSSPTPGLKALMGLTGRMEPFSIADVVFQIAPRINAAGRMGHANQAVKMLLYADEPALEQSILINNQNQERKTFDQHITLEALAMIERDEQSIKRKTTVVYHESWNKGVIGIVASRLTEKYYRPTIVLTESNGSYTGSARSVAGYDLYEALSCCAGLLEQFGGHKFAAGLTIKPENLPAFSEKFEQVVAGTIADDLLIPEIKIDAEIQLSQVDGKFFRIIQQMGPFGPENMSPVFVTHNLQLATAPQIVGTNHLKLTVKQQNSTIFEAIAFGQAEHYAGLNANTYFSACYSIEENVWKDKRKLQLNIKGIKLN